MDQLDVTLLAIQLGGEAFGQLPDDLKSVMLLLRERRHRLVAREGGCSDKRSLDDLEDGPALREKEEGALLTNRGRTIADDLLVAESDLSTKRLTSS